MKNEIIYAEKLYKDGKLEEAKKICLKILDENPKELKILILLSIIAFQTNHILKSAEILEYTSKIYSNVPEVFFNKSHVLLSQEKYDEALIDINKAIDLNKKYSEAYNLKGLIFSKQKKFKESIEFFNNSIDINKHYIDAYKNLSLVLKDLGDSDKAIEILNIAIKNNSLINELYLHKGSILKKNNQIDEAIECYDEAIKLIPNIAENYNERGSAYLEIKKFDEAKKDFDKAIKLNYSNPDIYFNLGTLENERKNFSEAIKNYEKVLSVKKDYKCVFGHYFYLKNLICDWKNYQNDMKFLEKEIRLNKEVSKTLQLHSIYNDSELLLINAKIENQNFIEEEKKKIFLKNKNYKNKIKICYYSADFRKHAVGYQILKLIELHDREKFEIYGISFLNQINDGMQNKFSKLFDKFINVEKMSNNEIVKLSRDLDIDIAIDLMCHTKLNRFSIFEKRCAPLQINFLGYPGTSGSDNIDYIIADKIIIPENESKNFTEKIIYLPPSFMVTDDSREISKKIFKKKDFDLPEKSFIFSNFNRIDKITPYIFDVWMDILHEVKNSSLWLISNNKLGIYNLKEEASKRGIDHKRLIFSDKVNSLADHIERIKLSDLCIDTFPYSSHTTGSDILWSGTPIVTLTGKTFASNVCGSMLKSLNLDELITSSLDEYKKKILELAKNPKKLLSIKKMIEERKETENLFNSKKYTNNFEIALSKIYKNCIEQKKLKNVILS